MVVIVFIEVSRRQRRMGYQVSVLIEYIIKSMKYIFNLKGSFKFCFSGNKLIY